MPVVLSTAEGEERSGYTYDDRTGVSYEYPAGRYERFITTGERFLYHKPGLGYSGAGIVGTIAPSATLGRLVCEVLDYEPFREYVPIRDETGAYYEADPTFWRERIYWGQGVSPLSSERYEAILFRAGVGPQPVPAVRGRRGYASPDVSAAVDLKAMRVAMLEVAALFPGSVIEEMPKNNPGFDIRIGPRGSEVRFVEVKGTQAGEPSFFLTEGERLFSAREARRYTLLVVVGINLPADTHGSVERRDGEVDSNAADLKPVQWRARLL